MRQIIAFKQLKSSTGDYKLCSFFTSNLAVLAAFLFIAFTSSCNSDRALAKRDQPLMDSAYYEEYMMADPAMKPHIGWARLFYSERKNELGWFNENKLMPQAEEMINMIDKAYEEGLDPKKYQLRDYKKLFADLKKARRDKEKYAELQKEVDIALTGTYFVWASDYYRGVILPQREKDIEWDVKSNSLKLHLALMAILKERNSDYSFASFSPAHPNYARLKSALATYRQIHAEGGWPKVSAQPNLKVGQASPAVVALRKRLGLEGSDSTFSTEVVNALKEFQQAQGLKPTGILNTETVRELNVPVLERIRKIVINMERWRWIPNKLEPDYLMVNIPEFKLYLYDDSKEVMTMNVIVGKEMNSTPVFSDRMEYIVLSPYWNVPVSIIKNEIAPKAAGNPAYLDALDMEVISAGGERIDAASIDWASVSADNWKYTLRRRPGPKNDLGDVKFMFPNSMNIYLHDTPNDALFQASERGFSHGCIRLEKPLELAEYLLKDAGYDRQRIEQIVAQRNEKAVPLKNKLPVYLVYFTAWADEKGVMHFRDDIYGHDDALERKYFSEMRPKQMAKL